MSTPARELRSMASSDPSEPAILHDCISGKIETWTGEFERIPLRGRMGPSPKRDFVFDGWGHVLGG